MLAGAGESCTGAPRSSTSCSPSASRPTCHCRCSCSRSDRHCRCPGVREVAKVPDRARCRSPPPTSARPRRLDRAVDQRRAAVTATSRRGHAGRGAARAGTATRSSRSSSCPVVEDHPSIVLADGDLDLGPLRDVFSDPGLRHVIITVAGHTLYRLLTVRCTLPARPRYAHRSARPRTLGDQRARRRPRRLPHRRRRHRVHHAPRTRRPALVARPRPACRR